MSILHVINMIAYIESVIKILDILFIEYPSFFYLNLTFSYAKTPFPFVCPGLVASQ